MHFLGLGFCALAVWASHDCCALDKGRPHLPPWGRAGTRLGERPQAPCSLRWGCDSIASGFIWHLSLHLRAWSSRAFRE